MQRFKKILVVQDSGSKLEPALGAAADLARLNGARIHLVEALRPLPALMGVLGSEHSIEELTEGLVRSRLETLQKAARTLADRDLDVTSEVLVGDPTHVIIEQVVRGEHDILIKTAEDPEASTSSLFGSLDLHLLRKCPCPVWMIGPEGSSSHGAILATVDVQNDSPEGRALDRKILELGSSLAARRGCEFHVAHCWELPAASFLRRRMSLVELEASKLRYETGIQDRLEQLVEPFREQLPAGRIHLLEGAPEELLPELSEKIGSDLIVMGTVGRSGLPGLLIGNTAERLLERVRCSVLTSKPEGFISPVVPDWAPDPGEAVRL